MALEEEANGRKGRQHSSILHLNKETQSRDKQRINRNGDEDPTNNKHKAVSAPHLEEKREKGRSWLSTNLFDYQNVLVGFGFVQPNATDEGANHACNDNSQADPAGIHFFSLEWSEKADFYVSDLMSRLTEIKNGHLRESIFHFLVRAQSWIGMSI